MSAYCSAHDGGGSLDRLQEAAYRRVLWVALFLNAGMFLVELVAGLAAGSVSLQADAVDFFSDAGSYGISLLVVGMALRYRAAAAMAKGAVMGLFGLWVIGATVWHALAGTLPDPVTMGAVGAAALATNAAVFAMLWRYRSGDSNMRSVWICSRNDVVGNGAVLIAALGVFGTGTGWPDVAVAGVMGLMAIHGAWSFLPDAVHEWRDVSPSSAVSR